MTAPRHLRLSLIVLSSFAGILCTPLSAAESPAAPATPIKPAPSEDAAIANFHSLGEIAGRSNIFRCANPVGAVAERLNGQPPTEADRKEARERMQHLYDLGVRTVVSLQNQQAPTDTIKNAEYEEVLLEKAAAQEVGIAFVPYSMSNRGKNSLQYQSSAEVARMVEAVCDEIVKRSEAGGVAFHCKSGKDRTGLVAGYLRIKYQHWALDRALVEMREKGHVWKKFLKPGAEYSWHEEHLRAIAPQDSGNQPGNTKSP